MRCTRKTMRPAMAALSHLRAPVDAFFDAVTVNAPDANLRANRLKLLDEIRAATRGIATSTASRAETLLALA